MRVKTEMCMHCSFSSSKNMLTMTSVTWDRLLDAEAACITLKLLGIFMAAHSAFCAYIAINDLTGKHCHA
jgi:hypothetical protein